MWELEALEGRIAEGKLRHTDLIRRRLYKLRARTAAPVCGTTVVQFVHDLAGVNARQWAVEDQMDDMVTRGEDGPALLSLVRRGQQLNQDRSALIDAINEKIAEGDE